MFTPPPSPQPKGNRWIVTPPSLGAGSSSSQTGGPAPSEHPLREAQKHRTGRRFRYLVLLIPLVLVAITVTARFLTTENSSYDLRSISSPLWRHSLSNDNLRLRHASLHKRNPEPQDPGVIVVDTAVSSGQSPTSTSSGATSPSSTPLVQQPAPTVPDVPPVLPTPFIQPFDASLPQNFSSLTCNNFFTNMTNSRPFRSCRPFSLLQQTSNTFISAQQNLTLLNDLVWGTCNTNTEESQCLSNMQWFASELEKECAAELKDNNALAVNTLLAIEAYPLMREAACLIDPTTNTYCFVSAARDTNPANLYYYSLPLGINLPGTTDPQCDSCLKSLMGVYSNALKNTTSSEEVRTLPGLLGTYEKAAELTLGKCGVGYALTGVAGSALGVRANFATMWAWGALSLVIAGLVL